jgi:prophage tail gpP-like protein
MTWLIGEVTYLRDERRGSVAEVSLMAPEAFTPAPTPLQLYDPRLDRGTPP